MKHLFKTGLFLLLGLILQAQPEKEICLGDILFPGSTSGGTITLDSIPDTATPTDSTNLAALLIGDNPCIRFDTFPYGGYKFIYERCSTARPDICKKDSSYFYNMDIGYFVVQDTGICDTSTLFIISSLFDTFTVGTDVNYGWTYIGLDSLQDSTTILTTKAFITPGVDSIDICLTREMIIPAGYVSSLEPDEICFVIDLFCCTTDTIICEKVYIDSGGVMSLKVLPLLSDSITWTKPDLTSSTLAPDDSLYILFVTDTDFGVYYATSQIDSCLTTFKIEICKPECSSPVVCFTAIVFEGESKVMKFDPFTGPCLWTLPNGDTLTADSLEFVSVTEDDLGIYSVTKDEGSCTQTYTINMQFSGADPLTVGKMSPTNRNVLVIVSLLFITLIGWVISFKWIDDNI